MSLAEVGYLPYVSSEAILIVEDGYLIYFQHFVAEAFLGASRVLAHLLQSQDLLAETDGVPLPRRVWFPRCGWKPSWRDDRGESA
jgi:hypothetical protein